MTEIEIQDDPYKKELGSETVGRIVFNANQPTGTRIDVHQVRSKETCIKNCIAIGPDNSTIPEDPLSKIVGSSPYRQFEIQPVEFITRNKLSFLQGCVVKRICRYDKEGGKGIEDLRKIIHEVELIMKLQGFDEGAVKKKKTDELSKMDPVDRLAKAHEMEIEKLLEGVDEGHRNEWAVRLARHFLDEYKNDLLAVSHTMRVLNTKNMPPLNDDELHDIVWTEYQRRINQKRTSNESA